MGASATRARFFVQNGIIEDTDFEIKKDRLYNARKLGNSLANIERPSSPSPPAPLPRRKKIKPNEACKARLPTLLYKADW